LQGRALTTYDLQEPFRWAADVTVMEAFDSRLLDLPGFYFTGDEYEYRLDLGAKSRFLSVLRERFNTGLRYRLYVVKRDPDILKWDPVIEQKAVELGRFLAGRVGKLDFSEPSPDLHRTDDRELLKRILGLSQREAERLGIGRSTPHYLRREVESEKPFRMYPGTREKLANLGGAS